MTGVSLERNRCRTTPTHNHRRCWVISDRVLQEARADLELTSRAFRLVRSNPVWLARRKGRQLQSAFFWDLVENAEDEN